MRDNVIVMRAKDAPGCWEVFVNRAYIARVKLDGNRLHVVSGGLCGHDAEVRRQLSRR